MTVLRVAEHVERTDTGRRRQGNEDAYVARAPLFAIADGMGGAQAGEVASGIAADTLAGGLPPGDGPVGARLDALVQEANLRIHERSVSDDDLAGMGTTLTLLHVGADELTLVHVGDSRGYRLRDGVLERITTDHTLVEELVRQGRLTPEEADEHPQRSIITRALGPEAGVEADTVTIPARDGDVYLLCSDGLTDMVSEAHLAELLVAAPDLTSAARDLIDAANAAGGRDNITVVLLRLERVAVAAAGDGAADDEATRVGASALRAEDVQRALAEAPPAPAPVSAPRAAAAREPLPPRAAEPARRRRRRIPGGLIAAIIALAIVLSAGFIASRAVYFVGVGTDGFVTLYRGVPWELPFGLDLYEEVYSSGVSSAQLTARQKTTITDHGLRSREDADDLVRQLELGRLRS